MDSMRSMLVGVLVGMGTSSAFRNDSMVEVVVVTIIRF